MYPVLNSGYMMNICSFKRLKILCIDRQDMFEPDLSQEILRKRSSWLGSKTKRGKLPLSIGGQHSITKESTYDVLRLLFIRWIHLLNIVNWTKGFLKKNIDAGSIWRGWKRAPQHVSILETWFQRKNRQRSFFREDCEKISWPNYHFSHR